MILFVTKGLLREVAGDKKRTVNSFTNRRSQCLHFLDPTNIFTIPGVSELLEKDFANLK